MPSPHRPARSSSSPDKNVYPPCRVPFVLLSRGEFHRYRRVIRSLPAVRREKVLACQQAIQKGTYHVDPHRIAEKMLEWDLPCLSIGA